jgi:hypothetical protein
MMIASVVVLGVGAMGACSSEPKDPFQEWSAAERFNNFVPPSATSVAQGTGTLTYKTPANGVLYLLDTSTMTDVQGVPKPRVIVTGYVAAGTEVTFNPQEKRVYAKGKPGIKLTNVDPTHTHEVRFDPSSANPKGV